MRELRFRVARSNSMRQTHQRGIAIAPILYIVAILAVLVSAIAAGSGSFTGDTSAISAKAQATAILEYADSVKMGVDRVLGKGYTDTQVSFEDPSGLSKMNGGTAYDYTNPNCTQNDCKVFNPDGGGIVPILIPADAAVDPSIVGSGYMHPQSFIVTRGRVLNLGTDTGTDGTDIILWVGRLKESVCMSINDILGIPNPGGKPPYDPWSCSSPFKGTYALCSNPVGDSVPALAGKQAFCVGNDGEETSNIFMRVLIVR